MGVLGVGQISLTDLNDALISGTPPINPTTGQLWIDTTNVPNMIKEWTGTYWKEIGALDPDSWDKISNIQETLGNMANDNKIDVDERRVVKDKLSEITGSIISNSATVMPTVSSVEAGEKGELYTVRKSARSAGIAISDSKYVSVATRYNELKSYLDPRTPVKVWDTSNDNAELFTDVIKDEFRDAFLNYYNSVKDLATYTSERLQENVNNIEVGGTNYASNGDFGRLLNESLWSNEYVGNNKEIVDISTEAPPFQYALKITNTSNVNGGIFTPLLWTDNIAERMVNRDVSISFWLKYENIVQGSSSSNSGRFGELVIEGETSAGVKVYKYVRVLGGESSYITGTNMTWEKYSSTIRITLPTNAVKITKISFKHGLQASTGTFWTTGIKIERGNKVTDWSESPYDLQDVLTKVLFEIQDDRIISKVTGSQIFIDELNLGVSREIDKIEIGGSNLLTRLPQNWEQGIYMYSDGVKYDNSESIRIIEPLEIIEDSDYIMSRYEDSYNISYAIYNEDMVYITGEDWINEYPFKLLTPLNAKYINFCIEKNPKEDISPEESEYMKFKFEKGNKATDWSESPYDTELSLTIVTNRINSVEQEITQDSIVTKLINSETFQNQMNTKADEEQLYGLVTEQELANMSDEQRQFVTDSINALDFEEFITSQEAIETAMEATRKFAMSGGLNLIRNSIGFAGMEFWKRGGTGTLNGITPVQDLELHSLGFGSGFEFGTSSSAKEMVQQINVIEGVPYTLSAYIKKDDSNGVFSLSFNSSQSSPVSVLNVSDATNGYELFSVTVIPTSGTIDLGISGISSVRASITGLMLSIGDIPLKWSLATGELYNTNIRMDINGIRVSRIDNDVEVGYTVITPDEFAGYYMGEKVFYLSEDETVSKKFRAIEEFTMGSVKIVKVDSAYTAGWAFVPITDSY